jgi:O-antigen/teichoic acid export membrane protein
VAVSLATLGFASVIIGFAYYSVDVLIRAHLIASAGIGINGLYQAAVLVSTFVTGIVLASVGTYSLATLSQNAGAEQLQARLNELLRIVLPVAAAGLGAVGLLGQPFFSVLFSSQFSSATRYLPLLLAANYVQVATWAVGAPLLGQRRVGFWIGIQCTSIAIRYLTARMLTSEIGAHAVALGLLLGMVSDLVCYSFVCARILDIRLARRTILAFVAGGVAVTLAAMAGSFGAHLTTFVSASVLLCAVTMMMAWSDLQLLWRVTIRRCVQGRV